MLETETKEQNKRYIWLIDIFLSNYVRKYYLLWKEQYK